MTTRAKIGVSRCLLGDAVRYDGQSKPCNIVIDELSKQFELVAVCPEVEAGLSIPRPPVQLTDSIDQPRLIGRDDHNIDITDLMRQYCEKKIPQLNELSGFIFKSRSPSCGLQSTPVFIDGRQVTNNSSGIFARAFQKTFPHLPVIEETQLESHNAIQNFINSISSASE